MTLDYEIVWCMGLFSLHVSGTKKKYFSLIMYVDKSFKLQTSKLQEAKLKLIPFNKTKVLLLDKEN